MHARTANMNVFNRALGKKLLPLSALLILLHPVNLSGAANQIPEQKLGTAKILELPLDYVKSARVIENKVFGFPNLTLIVALKEPMRVTSTLEGTRTGISFVGNHYTPPPCWGTTHELGYEKCKERVHSAIGRSQKNTCLLFTGADMRNLSIRSARFETMEVHALVTAGVVSNAVRMSKDEGRYFEHGTINIVLMANRRLTPRAMARAIISATEAKTAALQDLDVRSSSNPGFWQATGTGTDEVIVVEGRGSRADNSGGHCKLGELIARAVYEGVQNAVHMQNGLEGRRSVLKRIKERGIDIQKVIGECSFASEESLGAYAAKMEEILRQSRYASFVESAFALSDAYEAGLMGSLDGFESWCGTVAAEIAGDRVGLRENYIKSEDIPVVIRMSLNALLDGVVYRERKSVRGN
ncbi:MAG: adenosylcobinamide amidohydrolase [Syntrophobacteraceae bacterium]